ncbi:NTP transferase domain-containing protein [Maricaulis parjimensis]|uniref:NTP transferase domain-containing protein n=1 Tax=Maricaulis parjimensis TaxID=144023 RepID=UPI001EEE6576|nr:NTP transferase domain-containing protein [Maricaulis parjimensis]
MSQTRAAIILAAGQGTRMKSKTVKVLHHVGGRAMLDWTVDLARQCGADRVVTVYGAHSPAVKQAAEALGTATALQDPPLGTGHAVLAAREALEAETGQAIVLYADTPLITPETVAKVFAALDGGASVAVLGFEPEDPAAYGRLILAPDGTLDRIVEFKDADEEERAVRLVNSGVLAAPASLLLELLDQVGNDNANGEYYLTDVVGLARAKGLTARVVTASAEEVLGVNSRADLAEAEAAFQHRKRVAMMAQGVTLVDPSSVHFAHDTEIAADVVIEPNVVFGPGVRIGSDAVIRAFSRLEGVDIGPGAQVGPHANLQPGKQVAAGSPAAELEKN